MGLQKRGLYMNVGEKILQLRKKMGLSQEELAEKLNVTRQTISKWETNQSSPDFEKIVPLCDLFEITTDELLRGKSENITNLDDSKIRRKTACKVSISVFIYFLAIIWIISMSTMPWISEEITVSVFLLLCAIATVNLIYHFMSLPKEKETEQKKEKNKYEWLDDLVTLIFTAIYLLISFITMHWEITWILWIVYAIVLEIIHLALKLKGDQN